MAGAGDRSNASTRCRTAPNDCFIVATASSSDVFAMSTRPMVASVRLSAAVVDWASASNALADDAAYVSTASRSSCTERAVC